MIKSKQDYIKTLKINSIRDLQKYILNNLLELVESDKPDLKINALKELSRYSFPSNTYYQSSISNLFEEDFDI